MKNWLLLGLGLGVSVGIPGWSAPVSKSSGSITPAAVQSSAQAVDVCRSADVQATEPQQQTPSEDHSPEGQKPLVPVEVSPALSSCLGLDSKLWLPAAEGGDHQAMLTAISRSLTYLTTAEAATDYADYPLDITRYRVIRSLERFRQLLSTTQSAAEFQQAVQAEFAFYQSVGRDGAGTVGFTGYFEPTYAASAVPTAVYRYPIYRRPPGLEQWTTPHPTRLQLEGSDGLQGSKGRLQGLELAWLRDRLEAFLIQVQGSARLQMTDGTILSVGYAGRTDYPYTSVGRELVNAGVFSLEELTLPTLLEYFRQNPAALDQYLPRNQRFVFFQPTGGAPATGSLGVPVTAQRSIATDKSLMPPGALALIQTDLPQQNSQGVWETQLASRYVLDQDTGGAIRGAGRVDIFMGTGTQAGEQAGLTNSEGQLYYLLLKE